MSGAAAVAAQLRSESWAAGASRSSGGGCEGIPGFVGWLITYVQPLPQWMDELQGDPGAVAMRSSEWRTVESSVSELTLDLASAARALDDLDGRTVRALRQRYEDVSRVLTDVQDWAGAASSALALASTLVTACRDAICGLLNALARLADSLTTFTLNPFDKLDAIREFADVAWDIIVLARDLIEQLLTALGQLGRLLGELGPIVCDGLVVLQDLLGRMLPGIAAFVGGPVGYLLGTGLGDMLKADPSVGELDPSAASDDQAYEALMKRGSISSPVDLIEGNGLIDRISGKDQTAVSISTIRRPDGSTYTLVNLPSTLDWGILKGILGDDPLADSLKDYAPLNDLDSNIALVLMDNPIIRTQYERAVQKMMEDAGVPPGSDVVWSGFSQGGIMAGNLGADSSSPYNTIGVVTNGSPTEQYDIPSHIPVLQVEHVSDPVPKLDGRAPVDWNAGVVNGPLGPSVAVTGTVPKNIDWVVLSDPDGSIDPNKTHNADTYTSDFRDYLSNGGNLKNDWAFLNGTVEEVYVGKSGE